ncbi:zinc finger and BTB domain-containing protein 21 [Thalassophryne amazonica]|uniref:zinc finger and BTB domain-containing protein 21 n=1 Tax=Thalassophryne amazonica TaxID=390379 RepID=UPI001471E428|nr:zinc finger and BTB domain-containing protein 21 [Thalassophryne amazonica]
MESLVHYSNPLHPLSVLGLLNEQRLRGQMCDVVLVVGDQRYRAHKNILAASSEYFQTLFTRADAESLKVVNLDFCEPDAFEIVLNYIYSSSLFVDQGSLAAIQELGYSLGIPFLTNILSTRPHASYCVSRKRISFSEGNDNDVQTSVIVHQVRTDSSLMSCSSYQRNLAERTSPPSSGYSSRETTRTSESITRKPPEQGDASERKTTYAYASIVKGNPSDFTSVRPQLTSSVSFSDAEMQHVSLQPDSDHDNKEESEEPRLLYNTNVPLQGQTSKPNQAIDRSGPLIKSLLRRSLSMDSPVPVFSPTLELKELQNREQSVVKMASKAIERQSSDHNGGSKISPPLVLRSKYPSSYDNATQVERVVSVKDEPSSPLADPSDIVRITVEEALPVSLKDFQTHYDPSSRPDIGSLGKRKERADNRRYPFKKNRMSKAHHQDKSSSEEVPQNATIDSNENTEEQFQNKIFKCWNCLKVFRSGAGLHRHVNMYHNPEKPYACDICHKRFHTNFKVWTHCQTQHGVVQNPASSSTSSVLDEKLQKKLIEIVREREIKKALLWKLKRNKQSAMPSTTFAKKRLRPNFVCPYCGKAFLFQSQYRQHLRTHPVEETDQHNAAESVLYQEQDSISQQKNTDDCVYSCRLCNMKLSSLFEQGDHERGCRYATVCPYCGLRFSSPAVKKDHEAHCKFKKLTCLECMRTFKSSFSIWRHQVEVHNHNMMTTKEQKQQESNEEVPEMLKDGPFGDVPLATGCSRENISYSDSSGPPIYDSEDSSSCGPEDLSMGHYGKLVVKEEPIEEAVCERENLDSGRTGLEDTGMWPCEKCGNIFTSRKDLERHTELLCHIKPFICHICNKAFRTNFRLWSHFQSHMSTPNEAVAKEGDRHPSPQSPSPPMTPHNLEHRSPQSSVLTSSQMVPAAATACEESINPELCSSSASMRPELERQSSSHSPLSRSNSMENPGGPQEADTLFYHAPSLSALTFKRQYMCKLCHRTFKTAFSLWSHEQSHGNM